MVLKYCATKKMFTFFIIFMKLFMGDEHEDLWKWTRVLRLVLSSRQREKLSIMSSKELALSFDL